MQNGEEIKMDFLKVRLLGVILCGFGWAFSVTKEILI